MNKGLISFSVAMAMLLGGCGGGSGGSASGLADNGLVPLGDDAGRDVGADGGSDDTGEGDSSTLYQARKWTTGFQMSNPSREARNPSVKTLDNGTVFTAWVEVATGDQPSAVFASVLRADLPETHRRRGSLPISQLSDGDESVLFNIRWNFIHEVERFIPTPKLAVSEDGVGHVAWLQSNGAITSVYVSDYAPQGGNWSEAASVESTSELCSEIKLQALANGDAVLLWKQTSLDGVTLKGVAYSASTGGWGNVFDVADAVKANADIHLWEKDGVIKVAYLASRDAENDRLMVVNLDLSGSIVNAEEVDIDGLKGSLVGALYQDNSVLMWAEMDEFGFYSVEGSINTGTQWQAMPQIEDRPYDAGHLALTSIGNELHVVWRHKRDASIGSSYNHDLNTVKYITSAGVSDIQTLFNTGGAHPVLVNGGDGKLYIQWFASHTRYSEYFPGDGWKPSSQPFCMANNVISGSCFNSGSEHTLGVAGQYGASAWLESVNGMRSVVVSLSE